MKKKSKFADDPKYVWCSSFAIDDQNLMDVFNKLTTRYHPWKVSELLSTLEDLRTEVEGFLKVIPKDHKSNDYVLQFILDSEYDTTNVRLDLSVGYYRERTKEEMEAYEQAIELEKKKKKAQIELNKAQEIEQYHRLKAKYGHLDDPAPASNPGI